MRKQVEPDKICNKCGTVLVHGKEEIFCDVCKENVKEVHLEITIFFKGDDPDTNRLVFCSWKCVVKYLKEFPINKEYVEFISLPYVSGNEGIAFPDNLKKMLKAFGD